MLGYLARMVPPLLRSRLTADGRRVSRIERRVLLSEIDLNRHMNQATYAQVMEVGRMDLVIGSRAYEELGRQGLHAVVAEQRIIYRRELKPGQRYLMDTRATAMDGRLLVFETHLIVGDRVHAKGIAKLIFIGEGGVLSAEDATAACETYLTDPLPVQDWRVVAG